MLSKSVFIREPQDVIADGKLSRIDLTCLFRNEIDDGATDLT